MTTKNKSVAKTQTPKNNRTVKINVFEDEDQDEAASRTLLSPEIQAAITIQTWDPRQTVIALGTVLAQQIDEMHNGSMKRPEAMLLAQAHTLDALFNNLASLAKGQEYIKNCERFLRLALKAQGQCRTTLEALAAIKNPPVIFAKQANISNGHQQINNGVPDPQAKENKNQPNELLTELPHETLDSGRKGEAISINSELEAVGKIHRSANA